MKQIDPLQQFECMAVSLSKDMPPPVRVVQQVMQRVRSVEWASDWVLEVMAAGSCVAALAVAAIGFVWLSDLSDPLGAIFQIVPPIGL